MALRLPRCMSFQLEGVARRNKDKFENTGEGAGKSFVNWQVLPRSVH